MTSRRRRGVDRSRARRLDFATRAEQAKSSLLRAPSTGPTIDAASPAPAAAPASRSACSPAALFGAQAAAQAARDRARRSWCSSPSIRCGPTTSTAGRGSSPAGSAACRSRARSSRTPSRTTAITETAPGHAVTMSGRFPRSTGILRNAAGVEDPQAPLLTSRDPGASPYPIPRLRAHRLDAEPRSALARPVHLAQGSRRDPAAGSREAERVLVRDVDWRVHDEPLLRRHAARLDPARERAPRSAAAAPAQSWTLLLSATRVRRAGQRAAGERRSRLHLFPHVLPSDTGARRGRAALDAVDGPAHARRGARRAAGARPRPRSRRRTCSPSRCRRRTTSAIATAPTRASSTTTSCSLDRALGAFIDSLYKLRDSSTIVFALTADHGVTSFPELAAQRAGRAPPPRYDISTPIADAARHARKAQAWTLDAGRLRRHARDRRSRRRSPARASIPIRCSRGSPTHLRRRPGIARVDRVRDLAQRDTVRDAVSRRWLHMLPPDAAVEYVVTPVQGAYPAGAQIAEHGSPYDDDAHVPVIFYGAGIRPRSHRGAGARRRMPRRRSRA